jgi:hypothetical protein
MTHRSDDAKIATAAAQGKEQLLLTVSRSRDDAAICEDDFGRDEIIESEAESANQRPVASTQSETRHADATAGSGHGREAEWIRGDRNVGSASASGDKRSAMIGVNVHAPHSTEIDNDALAQSAPGPVMAPATNREREVARAGGANGGLNIRRYVAMGNGERYTTDRLCPDRGRSVIASIARP